MSEYLYTLEEILQGAADDENEVVFAHKDHIVLSPQPGAVNHLRVTVASLTIIHFVSLCQRLPLIL
jgi:hypothetical protein